MCVICDGTYDIDAEMINCFGCPVIESIPYLPNLDRLFYIEMY